MDTAACNLYSGMYCYVEASQCSKTPFLNLCSIRNGSATNAGDCQCGIEQCTVTTGLICYATIGGGSCRRSITGSFGYPRPSVGMCSSVSGRKSIGDKASCEAAGVSMGLPGNPIAVEISSTGYPQGCFFKSNHNLRSWYCHQKEYDKRNNCPS